MNLCFSIEFIQFLFCFQVYQYSNILPLFCFMLCIFIYIPISYVFWLNDGFMSIVVKINSNYRNCIRLDIALESTRWRLIIDLRLECSGCSLCGCSLYARISHKFVGKFSLCLFHTQFVRWSINGMNLWNMEKNLIILKYTFRWFIRRKIPINIKKTYFCQQKEASSCTSSKGRSYA